MSKRSKKKSRSFRFAVIAALLVGFIAGFALSTYLNSGEDLTAQPEVSPVAMEEPSATPLALEAEEPVEAETPDMTEAPAQSEGEVEPAAEEEATVAEPEEGEASFASVGAEDVGVQPMGVVASEGEAETAAETQAPTIPSETTIVAENENAVITADVGADGKAALEGAAQTVSFNVHVLNYLDPDYYQANYSTRYVLNGTEGTVGIEMTMTEGPETVRPQDAFKTIAVVLEDGTVVPGYQLVDKEIGADSVSNPSIINGTPAQVYKRFDYTTPVQYLRMSVYQGGVEKVYDFVVGSPVSPYNTLQKGDKSDAVKVLQEKLLAMGYLDDVADGAYGNNTVNAVMKAQAAMGLQQTGIADGDFQKQLMAQPNPTPAPTQEPVEQAATAEPAQAPVAEAPAAATQVPNTVG